MTTFNSSQKVPNGVLGDNGTNQKQHQRQLIGLKSSLEASCIVSSPLSTTGSSYYTTALNGSLVETVTDPASDTDGSVVPETPSQAISDDDDYYENDDDDDDVEIIMHDSNNPFDASLDTNSPPLVTAAPSTSELYQKHSLAPAYCLLQRQLEYYFSRQNLTKDTYLVSQMDPDLYVPIATIAKFKRVTDITSDMDFIVSTLRRSSVVTVNDSGTKVKPNISIQRTTVILREMPDATELEVKQYLDNLKSPPIKNIKKEYANMWYITFGSEEDALKIMYQARGTTFKGQYVATRMKSEPVVGSIQARQSALQVESLQTPSDRLYAPINNAFAYNHPSSNQYAYRPGNTHSYYYSNGNHQRSTRGRYRMNQGRSPSTNGPAPFKQYSNSERPGSNWQYHTALKDNNGLNTINNIVTTDISTFSPPSSSSSSSSSFSAPPSHQQRSNYRQYHQTHRNQRDGNVNYVSSPWQKARQSNHTTGGSHQAVTLGSTGLTRPMDATCQEPSTDSTMPTETKHALKTLNNQPSTDINTAGTRNVDHPSKDDKTKQRYWEKKRKANKKTSSKNQPVSLDLQSGTYFPPLPSTKTVQPGFDNQRSADQGATHGSSSFDIIDHPKHGTMHLNPLSHSSFADMLKKKN